MNPTEIAKLTYQSGKIVKVTKKLIQEQLTRIEDNLGFPHQIHKFNIVIIPKEIQSQIPINAAVDLENNIFATPEQQHEATIYHEGTHYIMGKNNLLFAPNIHKGTMYDRFIDETIAELATSQKYGYGKLLLGDSVELYKQKTSQEIKSMEETLDVFSNIPFEIASKHRTIEDKFRTTQNFESIIDDVNDFYQYLSKIENINFSHLLSEAVRITATDNAKKISQSNITTKKLVNSLNDGVKSGWDSYGLYFADIINNLTF